MSIPPFWADPEPSRDPFTCEGVSPLLAKVQGLKRFSRDIFARVVPSAIVPKYHPRETVLTPSDLGEKVEKIRRCGDTLELRATYRQEDNGDLEQVINLHNASYCQQNIVCPVCAARAQFLRRGRLAPHLSQAVKKYPFVYFLTFTIAAGDDLRERLDHLKKSFRRFQRYGQKRVARWTRANGTTAVRRFRGSGQWSHVRAGVVGIEVKRGKGSGKWHPHAHALVFCDKRLDFSVYNQAEKSALETTWGDKIPPERLRAIARDFVPFDGDMVPVSALTKEWYTATGGDSLNLDARPIRDGGPYGDITNQVKEVVKYPVFLDKEARNPTDLPEIIEATYNRRFFFTYGADFRGIHDDADMVDHGTDESPEIFRVVWSHVKAEYGQAVPVSGPLFPDSGTPDPAGIRAGVLRDQAKLTGRYRRDRNEIARGPGEDLEGVPLVAPFDMVRDLDARKMIYRGEVRELWRRLDFLPSTRQERPQNPRAPVVVQLDLFAPCPPA